MRDETDIGGPVSSFPATRWSAIVRAGSDDPAEREIAIRTLVDAYWKPIYKYLRLRWRVGNEDAKDLTQDFFARLVETDLLSTYHPEKARPRTFLRLCLDRQVQKRERAAQRLKRGGGAVELSLDFESAEGEMSRWEPVSAETAEDVFEREWVRALFGSAVETLGTDCRARDRLVDFLLFERYDLGDDPESHPSYADLARELDLSVNAVTNRLFAVRRRFRQIVLDKLREITGSEQEFQREARSLLGWRPE